MAWLDRVELVDNSASLDQSQKDLIDFLHASGVFKLGEFTLKSKRRSPTFANFGDVNTGEGMQVLGKAFATAIKKNFPEKPVTLVGPAYKGIPISVAAAMMSLEPGMHFTFDRKEEKAYGEATGASKADAAKKLFVGYVPKPGDSILYVDDITTTGATKIEEDNKLRSVVDVKVLGLQTAADREEMDENGENAMLAVAKAIKAPTHAIIKVNTQAIPYLRKQGKVNDAALRNAKAYIRAYGTEETKPWARKLGIVSRDKGLIPACDVPLETFEDLVKATADIDAVTAYKIPATAGRKGWETWTSVARKYSQKPLIYDHQKAGTDIPDTGFAFMKDLAESGFDAVILFPQAGPSTEWEWIHSAFQNDLEVIVGGEMTHPRYKKSEGGFIDDASLVTMYTIGAKAGVNNFVVPGNKPEQIAFYKKAIEDAVPGIEPTLYSPGLVAQGGKISSAAEAAGDRWQAIVGRGIVGDVKKQGRYATVDEMRAAAFDHAGQLAA